MQLIGMLDSPYVRRVAVTLQELGLPFEHRAVSVFRHLDEFKRINPVVKAPTLVCDDGETLMDSTLIIDHAESLAAPRSLMPAARAERQHALHRIGLALAGCEKGVQLVYERSLRPPERRHQPWVDRVRGQLAAALAALEAEERQRPLAVDGATIDQAALTVAIVWKFLAEMLTDEVKAAAHPALAAFSARAEARASFRAAPHGEAPMASADRAGGATSPRA